MDHKYWWIGSFLVGNKITQWQRSGSGNGLRHLWCNIGEWSGVIILPTQNGSGNIGELDGVILSPTQNGSQRSGTKLGFRHLEQYSWMRWGNYVTHSRWIINIGELGGIIWSPTQIGSQRLGTRIRIRYLDISLAQYWWMGQGNYIAHSKWITNIRQHWWFVWGNFVTHSK